MDKAEVKITIDADGTVRREFIEQPLAETKQPGFFKKLLSALSLCMTTQGNRN